MRKTLRNVLKTVLLFVLSGCTLNYSITDLNSQGSSNSSPVSSPSTPEVIYNDHIPPTISGIVSDGVYYTSETHSPSLSWSAGVDENSGIQKYQISIGTSISGSEVLNWTDIGNVTSYQVSGLSLSEGVTYYPSIRVLDMAGNVSTAITGDGWIPDATAPVIASVEDGDQIVSTTYSSWIAWPRATDAVSGLSSYEVRIVDGTNSGVTSWVNVGTSVGYGFTGLSLLEGQTYKAEVRATDNAGNVSSGIQGNGWYVVPSGWKQQAYIKAANADIDDYFGSALDISGDTLVVGAYQESSSQTSITNGTSASSDNSATYAGAVYVYKRNGNTWAQEAYLKPSNLESFDRFGTSVAIDTDTIAVGAPYEDSNQTTITNGSTASSNNSKFSSGAVYIFKRNGTTWAQEAYIKAANADANDGFGLNLAISRDTLVVGNAYECSNQTFITNGASASSDNSLINSGAVYVYKRTGSSWAQEAYIKAANAGTNDYFGSNVDISEDTIVVSSSGEDSNETFITNGATASSDNSKTDSGALYVYKRINNSWSQEAYIKAVNADANDQFGGSPSIDGDTIVTFSYSERSNQTNITNGPTASSDNSIAAAGAVYVYKRNGTTWAQEAYIKPSNLESLDRFGHPVISGDLISVGVIYEDSNQTSITNGTTASSDNSLVDPGAVYVFKRTGSNWTQEAYIKAANAESNDHFGIALAIDNNTIVVGANKEASNQTSITNGTTASSDNSASNSGAVYVYNVDRPANWSQQAYVKAANSQAADQFGRSVDIAGNTMVVGAQSEDSNQTVITNGTSASGNNSLSSSGAVYVYKRDGTTWVQEAYIKASNADANDIFGNSVAISGDTIVVGAYFESSNQTVITNGSTASSDNSLSMAGAAYVFKRSGSNWVQEAYLKPSNIDANDNFGLVVDIDGDTIVVGAPGESSNQASITNGPTASSNNSWTNAGAVYVFKRSGTTWTQEAYLKSSDGGNWDFFGNDVGISKDTVIVGAYWQGDIINLGGKAHIFKRNGSTWTQEAILSPTNVDDSDFFGSSVAIFNDTAVVGSSGEASNQTFITNGSTNSSDNSEPSAGALYVYKRSGASWSQEAYIKASNKSLRPTVRSLKIFNDTIVCGNQSDTMLQTTITNGTTSSTNFSAMSIGAAFVFKRTGSKWAQEAYLKAPNAEPGDSFGSSVSIWLDTIVVGASDEESNQTTITNGNTASSDNTAAGSGAAYIFQR